MAGASDDSNIANLTLEVLRNIHTEATKTNARLERVETEMSGLRGEMGHVRTELGQVRTELGETNQRLERVEQGLNDLGSFMRDIALELTKYERFTRITSS